MLPSVSLWQPWASGIACGLKGHETRSWPLPKGHVGMPVALHASKRYEVAAHARLVHAARQELGAGDPRVLAFEHNPPKGCIVAVITFGTPISTDSYEFEPHRRWRDSLSLLERAFGDFSPGRWAWPVRFVSVLPEPVPAAGRQGFWWLPTELERAVLDQLPTGATP